MADVNLKKEVYYDQYCSKCIYKDSPDDNDPCDECLTEYFQINSHKPCNFKEDK